MKNFKKALALFTALTTVAMSTSALAAVSGDFSGDAVTADYSDFENNNVIATVDMTKATGDSQASFVILDQDANEKALDVADIIYLDQKTLTEDDNSFTGVINLARITGAVDKVPLGSYPIKLGYYNDLGTFVIAKATMVVAEDEEGGKTVTILWGDLTGDGVVKNADAITILKAVVGNYETYTVKDSNGEDVELTLGSTYGESNLVYGDVTGDGAIKNADAITVLKAVVGNNEAYDFADESYTVGTSDYEFSIE